MKYIFVYGSCKRGYWSNKVLGESEFIGEFETIPNYKLYELDNGLPIMVEQLSDGVAVKGEIYAVTDEDTLSFLDLYERGAGYDRFSIQIKDWNKEEPVECYLYTEPFVAARNCGTEWPGKPLPI